MLRRKRPEHPSEPRHPAPAIFIQIDGLAYEHLRLALRQGYLPYFRHLITGRAIRLSRWRCGLPSTTPAVQAGILYGDNQDIPAFRWYDKRRRTTVITKIPWHMHNIHQHLRSNHRGLLQGGSSYVNMLDGDAKHALFTLTSPPNSTFFDMTRNLGFLLTFLILNPIRLLRILLRSLAEITHENLEQIRSRLPFQRDYRPIGLISPFIRAINTVIFPEIQTAAILADLRRQVPLIYTTYTGYDEVAHHHGPTSPAAFRILRRIDSYIRRIDRTRRHHHPTAELYILSDHGMSPAIPFHHAYGHTLGEWIKKHLGPSIFLEESDGGEGTLTAQTQYILNELRFLEQHIPPRSAALLTAVRHFIEHRIPLDPELATWNIDQRHDVIVLNSGSMAHVYFNVSPNRLSLSEIGVLYPGLLNHLLSHPGIGLIVGTEGEEVILMNREGTLTLNHTVQLHGRHPLHTLADSDHLVDEIRRIATFSQSGDLILFGQWFADGTVIGFEDQIGSHGGFGGPQDHPFIAYPPHRHLPVESITNARQLYPYLARWHTPAPT